MSFFTEYYSGAPILAPNYYPVTAVLDLAGGAIITGPDPGNTPVRVLPTFSVEVERLGSYYHVRKLILETSGKYCAGGFKVSLSDLGSNQDEYMEGITYNFNSQGGVESLVNEHPSNSDTMGVVFNAPTVIVTPDFDLPDYEYVLPLTVDGVAIQEGDRVLVTDTSITGAPGYSAVYTKTAANWTLSEDYLPNNSRSKPGYWHYVEQGTVFGGKTFEIANVDVLPERRDVNAQGKIKFLEILDVGQRWDIRNQYDYQGNPLYIP